MSVQHPLPTPASTAPHRLRVGLLPLHNETADARHDWLRFGLTTLVQQALRADERIEVMPAVLATQPDDHGAALSAADQARRASLLQGLDAVVHAELHAQGPQTWLDFQLFGPAGRAQAGSLREVRTQALGQRLAQVLLRTLYPDAPDDLQPVSDDGFVNQAHARAQELLSQEDYAAALPLFELVRELAPQNLQAELGRVRCLGPLGRADAVEQAQALLKRALSANDRRLQARAQVALYVSQMRRQPAAALQADAEVVRLADQPSHASWWREDWLLRHLINRGTFGMFRGDWTLAAQHYQLAEDACRACGHQLLLAALLRNAAFTSLALGELDRAQQRLDEALTLYRQSPQPVALLHLGVMHGLVDLASGRLDEACTHHDEVVANLPQSGRPMLPVGMAGCSAMAYLELGRRESIAALLLVLEERPEGLEHCPLASRLVAQAALTLLGGDVPGARQPLLTALDLHRDQPGSFAARSWANLLLRVDLAVGDRVAAEAVRQLIVALPDYAHDTELQAGVQRSRAAEAHADHRADLAAAILADVVREVPAGREKACAQLDLAWLCLESDDLAGAQALMQASGPWRTQHPAGIAADARLAWAQGRGAEAARLQQQALQRHASPAPPWHHDLLGLYQGARPDTARPPRLPRLVTESWWPAPSAAATPLPG